MTWAAVVALAAGTYAMKAAGPLALGSRPLPAALQRAFSLLAVTLPAALSPSARSRRGPRWCSTRAPPASPPQPVAVAPGAPLAVAVTAAAAVAAAARALG